MSSSPGNSTRAGYVTLVGRPNAGKSTLLNHLVGQHLSIVTPKAQTTWQRVTGILTLDDTQLIFLDTPGLLSAGDLLQRAMLGAALEAIHEADVVLVVIDTTRPPDVDDVERLERALSEVRAPVHAALNKIDAAPPEHVKRWGAWAGERAGVRVHEISAVEGTGVPELLTAVRDHLPESPYLYPADDVASEPVRFFVAELVRETVFEQFHEEIPYSVVCRVEELRENQEPAYVHVNVYVERASQKRILIGAGGAAIRAVGQASRQKIEHFLGRSVYLDLWVKPLKAWRKSRAHLGRLGFRIPQDDDARDS